MLTPAATNVLVQWNTATEINTAGFNLYRATSAQGPFTKINAQLIPASNDPLAGGKYRFEDSDLMPGQTYYYELEDIEFTGASTRHGPIVITAPQAFSDSAAGSIFAMGIGVLALSSILLYLRRRARKSNAG